MHQILAYLFCKAIGRESLDAAERITIAILCRFSNEKDKADIVMIKATIHQVLPR